MNEWFFYMSTLKNANISTKAGIASLKEDYG